MKQEIIKILKDGEQWRGANPTEHIADQITALMPTAVYIVVGQERHGNDDNRAVFTDKDAAEKYASSLQDECLYGTRIEEHDIIQPPGDGS